jgi:hypothetical protein
MIVRVGEADFAEVAEDGAGVQVYFADGIDVASGAGEFTGAAIDVYGVVDDGEARLRQGHSCGGGLIEGDGIAGFGYPVMLHFEQDVVAGNLRSTDQGAGNGTGQIASCGTERRRWSVGSERAKVGDQLISVPPTWTQRWSRSSQPWAGELALAGAKAKTRSKSAGVDSTAIALILVRIM